MYGDLATSTCKVPPTVSIIYPTTLEEYIPFELSDFIELQAFYTFDEPIPE
jgi:hypothetical protein